MDCAARYRAFSDNIGVLTGQTARVGREARKSKTAISQNTDTESKICLTKILVATTSTTFKKHVGVGGISPAQDKLFNVFSRVGRPIG